MDRSFVLEFVRVSEAAALASAKFIGSGDKMAADQAAVEAMRKAFESIHFSGTVKIGEGERDEAPMLYIGEQVGKGGPSLDIAVDPLEGTTICASGGSNSLAVIAVAEKGGFLHAPDTYMEKIAVGPEASQVIDLDAPTRVNLEKVAQAKGKKLRDLTVCLLDRPRHEQLICEIRETGARISLIGDGDVQAAIASSVSENSIDILMGKGGAPEGVLAAAALRCLGGAFQGRLSFRNEEEKSRARKMGIEDLNRVYELSDLASGPVIFCATGVTDGSMLHGVKFYGKGAMTHSMVMRSETGTVRYLETSHDFTKNQIL